MPELAEVDYYRKKWNPGLGETVAKVHVNAKARIYRDTSALGIQRQLLGKEFLASHAHGKRMMFHFSDGRWLGLHLGMTGKLQSLPPEYEREKHDHLVLDMETVRLVFTDPRMFGKLSLEVTDDDDLPPQWWSDLPPQVLDRAFTKTLFTTFVRRFPKTPLKTLLLDQRGFPGIGNWMADEICWRLRLDPATRSGDLQEEQLPDVWKVTRKVSRDAMRVIAPDWKKPPDSWLFNHRWKDGGFCPECGGELNRDDLRGRTTCWCPSCQN